jgi:hypothetical protein
MPGFELTLEEELQYIMRKYKKMITEVKFQKKKMSIIRIERL